MISRLARLQIIITAVVFGFFPTIAAADESKAGIESHVGYFASGTGEWRSPNPDYLADGEEPTEFRMSYKWGPHRSHIIAQIRSIYADGRDVANWTLLITYNPVTDEINVVQAGVGGVYFEGHHTVDDEGVHHQGGLIFLPNGAMRSVRDEMRIISETTYESSVFERTETGDWAIVRHWVWEMVQ